MIERPPRRNADVQRAPYETFETMLRRFKNLVATSSIMPEVRRRSQFESKSNARRRKESQRIARARKRERNQRD